MYKVIMEVLIIVFNFIKQKNFLISFFLSSTLLNVDKMQHRYGKKESIMTNEGMGITMFFVCLIITTANTGKTITSSLRVYWEKQQRQQ